MIGNEKPSSNVVQIHLCVEVVPNNMDETQCSLVPCSDVANNVFWDILLTLGTRHVSQQRRLKYLRRGLFSASACGDLFETSGYGQKTLYYVCNCSRRFLDILCYLSGYMWPHV